MRIIDFHTHLGDILHENGGALIYKKDVKKKVLFDMVSLSEVFSHSMAGGEFSYKLTGRLITRGQRARNATATLENFEQSAIDCGIYKSICMPIPPYLIFDDLFQASQQYEGIIAFSGVDLSKGVSWEEQLKTDVEKGAKGIKLHPNIQKVALNDERTYQLMDTFKEFKLPVLFHCGVSSYYLGKDRCKEEPLFGHIHYARKLVQSYPDVVFVAGHAGLFQVDDVMEQLGGFDNVWVETSFQPVSKIRQLLNVFGEDKVLFGSDWPYGNRKPAVRIMEKVCHDNEKLAHKLFHENAEALLGEVAKS